MKRRNPHLVFLSQQALDIFIALKTFAGGSDFVLPWRYDSDVPMSSAILNQVLTLTYKVAQKDGKSLTKFGPHDLRRKASTLLHEAGSHALNSSASECLQWVVFCLTELGLDLNQGFLTAKIFHYVLLVARLHSPKLTR